MPVGDGADHLLADELCPQGGALGGAGGAEPPLLAGEGDEVFVPAGVAPYAREAAFGKAAPEKAVDGLRDDPPQGTEGPFYVSLWKSHVSEQVERLNTIQVPPPRTST
jgi:hypothetical protein